MASLGQSFDPNSVAPDTGAGGGLHPAGVFEVEITESDVKPTSNGKGMILKFVAEGTGNPNAPEDNKGKKIYGNINVQHESAQAQAIGQGQLSALCAAVGFTSALEDSEQLHYQPFWVEVKHEQRMGKDAAGKYTVPQFFDDGSPKMNAEIKRYIFGDEAGQPQPPAQKAAPQAAPAPAQTAQAAPAAGGRTWQRRPAA